MLVTCKTFEQALSALTHWTQLVVDVETSGLHPYHGNTICGIGIASPAGERYYFPYRHKDDPDNLPIESMHHVLRILEHTPVLVGHNISFDLHFLHREGLRWPRKILDTMLLAHIMNENEPSYKLENLAIKYLDNSADREEVHLFDNLRHYGYGGKDAKSHLWELPAKMVEPYACEDIDLTERLAAFYAPNIETWNLSGVADGVMEYRLALTRMEEYGILVSNKTLYDSMRQEEIDTSNFLEICRDLTCDPNFKPNSSKQVCEALGIPTSRATTLEQLDSPLARAILAYRDHAKCNSTFYSAYNEFKDPDSLIHTHYRPEGTVTGRLSSSEPNLQQVSPRVRTVFIPRPGYEFLAIDYDQAELRIATHYASESHMRELILSGHDVHQETANSIGVSRKQGKIVTFASLYNAGPRALSLQMGVSFDDAYAAHRRFHATYPGFSRLSRDMQKRAERNGYIRFPLTQRVRRYPAFMGDPHKAMPNLIQGTLAEVVRLTLTRIHKEVDPTDARLILQVHDEFLMEVPKGHANRVFPQVAEIMTSTAVFNPPLTVSAKVGPSWGTLQTLNTEKRGLYV